MTSNNNLLEKWLSENKIKFIKDFNIKNKSWLKAGGVVKTFITPNNEKIENKLFDWIKLSREYLVSTIAKSGLIKK